MSHRTGILSALSVVTVSLFGVTAAGTLTGCAVNPNAATTTGPCTLKQGVLPATAVADHTAASPGNQQAFDVGFVGPFPAGCAIPQVVLSPANFTWVSSDPINAPISNTPATAGIATCAGTTTVPATISVSSTTNIAVATLTCK